MARKGVRYRELAIALNRIGIDETEQVIVNKINRGKFSFAFALQVFEALNIKKIMLGDADSI